MAYQPWSVVFGETPSASKWNILGTNDSGFNDGTAIGAGAIGTAALAASAVTPPKMSDFDWFKYVPASSFWRTVAGTWTRLGSNTGTGFSGWDTTQSNGAQNEEIEYKIVLAAGTYSVYLHVDKDVNRGIITVSVDGVAIGTVDTYNASRVSNAVGTVTTALVVATNKTVTLNLKMASKNASSSLYYGTVMAIELVRTA